MCEAITRRKVVWLERILDEVILEKSIGHPSRKHAKKEKGDAKRNTCLNYTEQV